MSDDKVKRSKVRDPMEFDTRLYDPGLDCRFDLDTGEEIPSLTKQSFQDECDINVIMARYEKTGQLDHVNTARPEFGDFAAVPDYQTAMNTVLEANSMFDAMPSGIRDRFGNDPAQLLAFVNDPANREEAIELGIVDRPPPEPAPQKVEVVNSAPPPSPAPQQT